MKKKRLVVFLLCLGLVGCTTTYGKPITLNELSQLKKAITAQADVIKLLGEPQSKRPTAKGRTIWVYAYTRSKASASTYIPIINVLKSRAKVKTQILQILFDEEGIYQDHSFSDSERELKSGLF